MKIKMIKLSASFLLGLIVCSISNLGLSQDRDASSIAAVRMAFEKSAKAERLLLPQFKTIFGWLTTDTGSEKWRKIQWRHSLLDARVESVKLGKPIFIWAMNGDPLGCV